VDDEQLREIIRAGIWAPSGKNNQPCRFVIIRRTATREALAALTVYSRVVLAAPALVAVYLDTSAMYDEVKDHQAAGACLQNMLLAAHALGLGAVWLGQILKNKDKVNTVLDVPERYDLMAVVAIGHPRHRNQQSTRKSIDECLLTGGK